MAGDSTTGVSIMEVTAGLDSGPVCLQESRPIRPGDTYGTLAGRLQTLGGELLVRALDESPPCAEQDETLATYAEKISAEDRELDPAKPAGELERVVLALTPHIGAHVTLADGTLLGVREARVGAERGVAMGEISFDGPLPVLGCADGELELVVVQPPGKRPMPGEAYLRGRR
jgi:methionyl-tRNA formyltransferase